MCASARAMRSASKVRPTAERPPRWITSKSGDLIALAFAAGTAVVLFADILVEPGRFPLGLGRDLELLRPRTREDLGIIDGQVIGKRLRSLPGDPLGGLERVSVHAIFVRMSVEIVVQAPALEIRGFNHQRVAFPVAHRIAVERRLEVFAMLA